MTKLAIIPCTVFLERLVYRKMFSLMTKLSIALLLMVRMSWNLLSHPFTCFFITLTTFLCEMMGLLCQGVGVATVTDVQLNMKGTVLSVLALFTTCFAQIWTGTTQKRCAKPPYLRLPP
jgi:solute carrier family 35 protein E3